MVKTFLLLARKCVSSVRSQHFLGVYFFGSLVLGLLFWTRDQAYWLLTGHWWSKYDVTEWMINYHGGFARRGLPGEILFMFTSRLHLSVGWTVFATCIILYCLYFLAVSIEARKWFPFWGLCSAPLLGYPVYSGVILRKDVFLLLSAFATAKIISSFKPSLGHQLLIALVASFAILSHELYLFIGVPACLLANIFSVCRVYFRRHLKCIFLISAGWAPPLAVAAFVLQSSGTEKQAERIFESWTTLTPMDSVSGPLGALSWIGRTPREAIEATHSLLSSARYGLPIWAWVALALTLAATVITLLFRSSQKRSEFAFYFFLQTLFMSPIFFSALDQGRWIFLTINSAFIFSLLFPPILTGGIARFMQDKIDRLRTIIPPIFCVFVLLIWGFPYIGFWDFRQWILSTPLLFLPSKIYFYLRVHDVIPSFL